jgi:hypothetical protein
MFSKGSQVSKCIPIDVPNGASVLSHMVGRTYELISIHHTMSLTKQGKNSFKKKTLAKVYIQKWPIQGAFEFKGTLGIPLEEH